MLAKFRILATALTLCTISLPVLAEDFPARPIHLIIPFAPGGGTDLYARVVADKMGEILGQRVLPENRPGGASSLGADVVAHSKADGYTLLMATTTTLSVNPYLYKKLTYKPEDFDPISLIASAPLTVVVHPSVPAKNLKEFMTYLRANPGKVAYSTPGIGSTGHLVGLMIEKLAGIPVLHVPYTGTGPALVDLRSGVVQFTVTGVADTLALQKAGQLRLITLLTSERLSALPDLLTATEEGFPDLRAPLWYGLVAPAGTPAPILAQLNDAAVKAMRMPEVRDRLAAGGAEAQPTTVAEFSNILKDSATRWKQIVQQLNIQLE